MIQGCIANSNARNYWDILGIGIKRNYIIKWGYKYPINMISGKSWVLTVYNWDIMGKLEEN
jgi:hypothetical protein